MSRQANAKYNPVRTLLEAAPARGVSRNDFLGSLLHGMIEADVHAPGASKYDLVRFCRMAAHELRQHRSTQAVSSEL